MRKLFQSRIIFVIAAVLVCAVGVIWAISPHFVGKVHASINDTSNLLVTWKETGLGNTVTIDYEAYTHATATYVCVNHGGQYPNAANKTTVSETYSVSGKFKSGKIGNINGAVMISPPGPGSFSCPPSQKLTLSDIGYSNIHVKDKTNDITKSATPPDVIADFFTHP